MNITKNLVIQHELTPFCNGKPYRLFIANHGRVGDKFNFGHGKTGKQWPIGAADHFQTAEEAFDMYYKFLEYVEDKIKQIPKTQEGKQRPSYYTWS
jgi:hypothetical protein